jgi:glycosyltransferase involved in cell wall biosynthesis
LSQLAKVSVIVAVLDRAATLQNCLDSVFAQTHRALELIVFDGDSKDGSREIVEANSARIAYWESRRDRGVAHAWNMALEHATGEWICFLGADDRFARPDTIVTLIDAARWPGVNYVSGQTALVDDRQRVLRIVGTRWDWRRMKRYQHIAHPGSLHHRDLFARYGNFDECYVIAFDYEFLLRAGRDISAEFVNEPVTFMGTSGQSNTQAWRAFEENRQIQRAHPEIGTTAATINHLTAAAKHVVRSATGGV